MKQKKKMTMEQKLLLGLELVLLSIQSIATMTAMKLIKNYNNNIPIEQSDKELQDDANKETEQLETITEELASRIEASKNINEEEKSLIWNENLIENVAPYYKDSGFEKDAYTRHTNIDITGFEGEIRNDLYTLGYYIPDTNVMYVRDYEVDMQIDEENIDTLYHEYIHLLQVSYKYRVLSEGSAEIIREEFYNRSECYYPLEVRYTKILMEIIGPEPIWKYNFEENSQALEEAILPYLEDKQYHTLMQILNLSHEDFPNYIETLNDLLNRLYYNKYGTYLYQDEYIQDLLTNIQDTTVRETNEYFKRIYFNEEKMDEIIMEETNRIPLEVIDENCPLYKLRPIKSIEELKRKECVYIDESGNLYAKKFVTSEEYFYGRKDQEYRYITIEEYLMEKDRISKEEELKGYHLENNCLIYTINHRRPNVLEKFPDQSIEKSPEYTRMREKQKE